MSGLPTSGNTPEGSRRFSNQCSGHYAHLTPDFYLPKKIPGEMDTLTLVLRLIKYVIFPPFKLTQDFMCLTYISWEVFNCTSDWAVKGYVHSDVVAVTTCTMYIRTHGVVRTNRIYEDQEVSQDVLSRYEVEV